MSPIAIIMYVIGGSVGAWSAVQFWRHVRAKLLIRNRAATSLVSTRRRPFFLARSIAGVAAGSAAIVAGAWLGGNIGSSRLDLVTFAAAVLFLVLALGALYAGFRFDPARGRRRCGRCWTPTAGLASLQCPARGRKARSERALFRTRRSPALVVLGLALLGAAHTARVYPDVRRQGLKAGVPTTALVVAWPWLPVKLWREAEEGASGREFAPWQRRILRWHCERAITSSIDRTIVGRAARAFPNGASPSPSASPRLLAALFAEYCSDDQAVSDKASRFLYEALTSRFIPPTFDDSTAAALVEPVRRGLGSTNVTTVERSAATAAHLGAAGLPLLPLLEALVKAPETSEQLDAAGNAALCAIGSMATRSDEAWRSLLSLTEVPSESVQVAALQEMTRAGLKPRGGEISAHALTLLESPSEDVAATAVTTVIFAGAEPCAASAMILTRAQRSDAVASRAVQYLAAKCPSEDLHNVLGRMLVADDHRTRCVAVEACAALGAVGTRHREALLRLASGYSSDPDLAEAAVVALAKIERDFERAMRNERR